MNQFLTFTILSIENFDDVACNWRIISGHSLVSSSNMSCSISSANNASHGVVAECTEKNPVGCDPPRNGINVDDTLDFGSLWTLSMMK